MALIAKPGSSKIVWEDAPTKMTRRCTFSQYWGETGTGRTSLALTAPGPIALLHASEKLEGIVQKVSKKKKVKMYNFGGHFKGDREAIAKQAHSHIANFKLALADAFGWARTIVIDTHTELWELLRLARFGTTTPKGVVAHLYGPVNAEWRSMFKQFREQDKVNIIAIGQAREMYRNDKPTGIMEQAGQNAFHYMADIVIQTTKKKGEFGAVIEKGWMNAEVEGENVDPENMSYGGIVEMITGIDASEWM